ncbi:MAG: hypothetical protein LBU61_03455 [Coriobacteriales bacterium]|jgi:hypothetical protein|nr:hypothetical protein [Coriobacteriales bacterium]
MSINDINKLRYPFDSDQELQRHNRPKTLVCLILILVALVAGVYTLLSPGLTPQQPLSEDAPATSANYGAYDRWPWSTNWPDQKTSPNGSAHAAETPSIPDIPDIATTTAPAPVPSQQNNQCPIPLAGFCHEVSYNPDQNNSIWQGSSELSCADAAEQVLVLLQNDEWVLEEYGYLDLFGNAWGCVVSKKENGEALVITVMPKHKYEPISSDNPMLTNVLYLTSEPFVGKK